MRARFITGGVGPGAQAYRGRYCTPWREGQSVSDPALFFPGDWMTYEDFIKFVWRVRAWVCEFSYSFHSIPTDNVFSMGGTVSCPARALIPPLGQPATLGLNDEHRLGAGFYQSGDLSLSENVTTGGMSVAINGYTTLIPISAVGSIGATINGNHAYQPPIFDEGGAIITPQKFKPVISAGLSYNSNPGAPGSADVFSASLVHPDNASLDEFDGQATIDYGFSEGRTDTCGIATTSESSSGLFPGPGVTTVRVSIRPAGYWPYADENEENPIYDEYTGAQLLPVTFPPTDPAGAMVLNPLTLPGVHFVR